MEFNLPTTKTEMYAVLLELFNHYRVRKQGYEEAVLEDLVLERLEYENPSDEELMQKAENLLKAEHEREIKKYQTEILSKISALQEKLSLIEKSYAEEVENINNLYAESIIKVKDQALKSGLLNSTVIVDKTAQLEDSKNLKLASLMQEKNEKIAGYSAEIELLNSSLSNSSEHFSDIHAKEIQKKFIELTDEREKKRIEVFKYNNSLDEKEQRFSNSIKESKCSLYLRYLDVKAAEYTKDQLVEMGYFADVITCITAYYDTLEPLTAYQSFLADKDLMMYLDFYYEQTALYYKYRAGL
ncbi:MAG: hypothetical protein E7372_04620 [Clostridiales bacterium]|nr:hypothetical protein [Clostridiales bacterium]